MKHVKTLVVALALILGTTGFIQAQDLKVAHIATQDLLTSMPQYKQAQADLEKLQSSYDAEMNTMAEELKKTMTRYGNEAPNQTDETNLQRQAEVEQTRNKIMEYRQNALRDLQKKEAEALQPIIEKARTAIQKVARAKGYKYVLDSTTGTGLILADGYDLMPDVKKELGI